MLDCFNNNSNFTRIAQVIISNFATCSIYGKGLPDIGGIFQNYQEQIDRCVIFSKNVASMHFQTM